MAKFIVGLLVVLLIALGVWFVFIKEAEVKKVTKEGPIIFFGDSLTAGVGAFDGEDFPTLVAKELDLKNVTNAGVSGDTTVSALARLKPDVLDKNPSLVIVELSGNDFLQQVAVEETIKNLDSIVSQIRKTDAAVLIVNIKFPLNNTAYESGFKEIEKKYNVRVVWDVLDGIATNPSLMADTIHPNAAGYKIMANRISKVLKELL
jgi:lysophospholipase L1-like esterase